MAPASLSLLPPLPLPLQTSCPLLGQAETFIAPTKTNKSGFNSSNSRGDLFGRNRRDVEYEKNRQAAARIIQFYTKPYIVRQTTRTMNAILMRTAHTPPTDGCGGSCFTRTVGSSFRSPMGAPAYRGIGHSECAVSSGRYMSQYSSMSYEVVRVLTYVLTHSYLHRLADQRERRRSRGACARRWLATNRRLAAPALEL